MGLIGGMARTAVVAGTATAVSNRVSRRQSNRWAEKDQAARVQRATPVRATPVRATPVRATPVRATAIRATPVRPTAIRAAACSRTGPCRSVRCRPFGAAATARTAEGAGDPHRRRVRGREGEAPRGLTPQLKRRDARRIAIRAQRLDANRPRDFATLVDQLTLLQLDPTAAVAPSADLVAWSRLGESYEPAQLQRALEVDHTVFEHRGQESPREPAVAMVRPMSRLGLYLAEMRAWPTEGGRVHQWLESNDVFRRQVLGVLRTSGPLRSRDIPDTCAVPWASTGWTNDRNVTQMLEFLAWRGEVAVAGRQGRQRVWDVSERIYPGTLKAVAASKARAMRDERRLRALGVA